MNNKLLMLAVTGLLTLAIFPSQAVELADGTTSFVKSPRLLDAVTTQTAVYVWGAKYYFIIALPENAGETLQKVTIQQKEAIENIEFNLEETFAFEGTNTNRGQPLTIKEVSLDQQTNTITVIFEPQIEPGKTFTIGFKPYRNPQYEGIYLFGITAYPRGDKPSGLYLGVGRLQFYRGGGIF